MSEFRFNLLEPQPPPETHEWVAVMADPQEAKGGGQGLYPVEGYGEQPGAQSTLRFVCLPDTVDPRGPKGKRMSGGLGLDAAPDGGRPSLGQTVRSGVQ